MSDTMNVLGVKADGSSVLLGTAPPPPKMKREDLAREQFGPLSPDESGNDADCCLWALEMYHEWLLAQGWQAPPLVVSPANSLNDAEVGRQWREDSSLQKWFPLTAERLAILESENAALKRTTDAICGHPLQCRSHDACVLAGKCAKTITPGPNED
jgi:hypothetical protein